MTIKMKRLLVFLVLFIFIFASYFIVNSYAKYKTNVIARGSTETAKWEVLTLSEDRQTINLSPGGDANSYLLRISSKSDVKVNYSVIISNIPSDVMIAIDDGSFIEPTDGVVIFNNVGYINASDATVKEHTLSFKAALAASVISDRELDLDVKFTQEGI